MSAVETALARTDGEPAAGAPRRGFFRRRFGRWIALTQYGFPFSLGPYPTPVARFRAVARRTRFAKKNRLRVFATIAMALGWPFGAFSTALRIRTQMRQRGQAPHGAGVLFDMYWLALRHSIPPMEYALYRFNEPQRRKDMHAYVYWNDLPGLAALNARLGADNRQVQDKDRFAEICAAHGFPHVQTLAVFENGNQTYPAAPFVPDAPALWVKALRLKGGAGGAKWIKQGDAYCDARGKRVAADKFASEIRRADTIVQPYVENHPEIAHVSNGALACLRIVTGMNATGTAEFVVSLLGLARGTRTTSVSAIMCSVDPATGRIRRAVHSGSDTVTNHPGTGAPIVGIELPFWRESVELVQRAHAAAFARFAFLGWDVALTKQGPLLLETNSGWSAMYHQMLDGPLGHTAFTPLVAQYV